MEAVAKSCMSKGFLIYEEMRQNTYMRRPLVINDFATAPFCIFLYCICIFISVEKISRDQREVKKRREIGSHTG
jgi:hypothetical protein